MRSLSHTATFHILRVLSGKRSSESYRAEHRMVLLGTSLCPLLSSLASQSKAHQRLHLCSQLFHRWCKFERLYLRFLYKISYGRLNRVHGLAGIQKHPIFCTRFLLKSPNICIRNPEARFLRLQISAHNSFPADCLYLSLA